MCTLAAEASQPWSLGRFAAQAATRHARGDMADLEKLAVRRDRGYLVRLVLLLVLSLGLSVFVFAWLTGSRVSGCMTNQIGGSAGAKPGG
jgi:hypothetical protein